MSVCSLDIVRLPAIFFTVLLVGMTMAFLGIVLHRAKILVVSLYPLVGVI